MFQGTFEKFQAREFQEEFKEVSMKFQRCFIDVSRVFQEYFRCVSRKFHVVTRVFQGSSVLDSLFKRS